MRQIRLKCRLNGAALIVILLLCAGCSLGGGAAATPSATITLATTLPRATFTNPTYGYSIDYPTDVIVEAERDEFIWLDGQISILVSSFNPEEAIGGGQVIETAADIVVGNFNARRLSGTIGAVGGNTPQRYESLAIPHEGSYYVVTVYELRNDVVLPAERELGEIPPEARDLFEQVVSSFRFEG